MTPASMPKRKPQWLRTDTAVEQAFLSERETVRKAEPVRHNARWRRLTRNGYGNG